MKKWMLVFSIGISIILSSCGGNTSSKLSGSKPPETKIQIGNETFPTILGTYCWSSMFKSVCADTAGPEELLEGKAPIVVQPGDEVVFEMDYEPLPNEVHVAYYQGGKETEVKVENHRFTAPKEKGVYYYSYGVWWMDENEENVSNADAFYAFALEVK
ncbi:hypothetical protein E1I69_09405 [Bacillus timonensis]|uniref:Lipoprotein n=1 Tax=Bacillus timonensis TaxID=1033734 RepID=A0A4S3PUM7_9BACI|nr:hypothetical protein [Bacillus timonensis]THE13076.1 hypothetical protein E1I69_09405 [Bacillus timonensis]